MKVLILALITIAYTLIGICIVHLLQRVLLGPKPLPPKKIDLALLKKYEKRREIDDADRTNPTIRDYITAGFFKTGLSKNAVLTLELTETAKKNC